MAQFKKNKALDCTTRVYPLLRQENTLHRIIYENSIFMMKPPVYVDYSSFRSFIYSFTRPFIHSFIQF